jgi:hypothetical protein
MSMYGTAQEKANPLKNTKRNQDSFNFLYHGSNTSKNGTKETRNLIPKENIRGSKPSYVRDMHKSMTMFDD